MRKAAVVVFLLVLAACYRAEVRACGVFDRWLEDPDKPTVEQLREFVELAHAAEFAQPHLRQAAVGLEEAVRVRGMGVLENPQTPEMSYVQEVCSTFVWT